MPIDKVYWYTLREPKPQKLEHNLQTEVVVVGGGFAGLICAHELISKGKKVVLVESTYCGGGASGKSSGFITPDSELELSNFVGRFGDVEGKKLWEFGRGGVALIRELIQRYGIQCDYQVQDSLFIANTKKGIDTVKEEYEIQTKLGYKATLYTRGENLHEVIGSDNYYNAVRYPDTFGMVAYLFCQALKDELVKKGAQVYEQTPVDEIHNDGVKCGGFFVKAQEVVVCADRFLPKLEIAEDEIYCAQTFLTVTKPLSPEVIKKIFPGGNMMVWDTNLIYQYYRITGENRLLMGAASMFYTYLNSEVHNSKRIERKMKKYLAKMYPGIEFEFDYFWPGLIGVSKDFAPLAGRDPEMKNVYFVGAAAGLPWATALGRYIAEKITTGRSDLDQYFTHERSFPINRGAQFVISKPVAFAVSHGISKYFR